MLTLNWLCKAEAKQEVFTESKTSCALLEIENDYITNEIHIGDNLDVLKCNSKRFNKRIKCIYIDPPYNTGKDFIYKDKWKKGKECKHSKWLSFMYPRLMLARDLLRDDGVIFISINDNEQANLKLLMNEIFGEENFVSQFVYRRRKTQANLTKYIAPVHEYVFAFARNLENLRINKLSLTQEYIDKTYKNPDNDPRGAWQTKPLARPENTSNAEYELELPNGRKITAKWSMSKDTFQKYLSENLVVIPRDGEGMPRLKIFLKDMEGTIPNSLLIDIATNEEGSKEIENLFGTNAIFDTPKPVALIKHLLKISTKPGDLVLDFFAGSGTTAQAVMELNFEEAQKKEKEGMITGEEASGGRRFILVQLPEKIDPKKEAFKAGYRHISEITLERVRRAGEKYKGVDVGFKVFEYE
jgi:adenine-specific DNA-methyltransferase